MGTYRRDPVAAPVLKGIALKAFVSALESPAGSALLGKILVDSGFQRFREADPGHTSPIQIALPWPAETPKGKSPTVMADEATSMAQVTRGPRLETVGEFARAYKSGSVTPSGVVAKLEKHIAALDDGGSRMNFFIARKPGEVAKAAEESSERVKKGTARSVLEGVPVVIKDELDVAGFPTTLGTKFLKKPAAEHSTIVQRLVDAGAVVLGKANMHEIGINPIGFNAHYGQCRNPWNRGHITGGSSSASAATVAAGLAPIAIGADGGGSIRIPAALCGVVGLKATWGRISEAGVPPLCWNPGHAGPIGLTVADVAATYAIIAGKDARDRSTDAQPPVHLEGIADGSLAGVRLGVCRPWFDDADVSVTRACQAAIDACVKAGAKVVEIPPPDMNTMLWLHAVIILSEMASAMAPHYREDKSRFGLDVRVSLRIGSEFTSTEYVHAMRHRAAFTQQWVELFKSCDAVVTPTTASTAAPITESALPEGESNLQMSDALLRFIRPGNITGFPGLSVPAGYDDKGLPIGIHFQGRAYEEALLLRLGRVVEASVERRVPPVHVSVL
jgi:Asp-tRNA(Asn)/Glu-tRNA(Gln) amidotransferase A subunit family amidase